MTGHELSADAVLSKLGLGAANAQPSAFLRDTLRAIAPVAAAIAPVAACLAGSGRTANLLCRSSGRLEVRAGVTVGPGPKAWHPLLNTQSPCYEAR